MKERSSQTIDIIIPSFRLDKDYLLPLINLPKPAGWSFNYFIIADNSQVEISNEISKLARENVINLFINPDNLGAAASRNKGIEAGTGAWILFLDDDVEAKETLLFEYVNAIQKYPDAIGFIGLTDFPPPFNDFTKAVETIGLTAIFKIASITEEFMWGVTANMMYNRAALQEMRFSEVFPKNGGGEDVDLPVRICMRHHARFRCLKQAVVTHPWWNNGKVHYDRFVRYGVGTAYVLPKFREYTWYGFPNPVESLLLVLISSPVIIYLLNWQKWLLILVSIPVFEILINYLRSSFKGQPSVKIAYHMSLLRASGEWGLLKTGIRQRGIPSFMQRINVDFARPTHFRLNRWRIMKMALFILLFVFVLMY